ncbi:MAG: amino acid permease, partial [Euryarchaeota archaeon]|nr:amino acid permease [Euryarchaeota archaeon]
MEKEPLYRRVKRVLLGAPRDLFDPKIFHSVSLIAFFAWVGLGADGISSSSYGPEEAYLALGGHTVLALFVAAATVLTVFIISGSYAQIIEAFPSGGGGYIVASKLLGERAGVVSGSALVIDYVLTITISLAAGADAIFSFLPPPWLAYKFSFIVFILFSLIWINLRGVKEAVVALTPIFIAFLFTHVPLILYAVLRHTGDLPGVAARVSGDLSAASREMGWLGVCALLLRAYSMGAGTYTGIEAVSNSMQTLREPRVQTGKRTMAYLSVSLAFMAGGIILGYVLNGVTPVHGKTLNAVLFGGLVEGLWQGSGARLLVAFVLFTEAVLLFVAAQTGFLDGPQVLSNMAVDSYMPHRFAHLSERLVRNYGVYFMGGMAFLMLFITGGSVRYLVIM